LRRKLKKFRALEHLRRRQTWSSHICEYFEYALKTFTNRCSKFEHSKSFGQVCSAASNSIWLPDEVSANATTKSTGAGRAVVGANEDVIVWDIKKGELVSRWTVTDNTSQVTVIKQSDVDKDVFAVGYEDGKIRVWDSRTATVIVSFNGHKAAITHLQFDSNGARLISGAKDTDIILWDLVSEVGLFKLRGHKDQITSLNFLRNPRAETSANVTLNGSGHEDDPEVFLLSTSKDALIKLWDMRSQHCIETHVAQSNGECWALGLSPDHSGCISAGNDGELKAWSINVVALRDYDSEALNTKKILHDRGSFYRHGKDRTTSIVFHPQKDLIAIHGSEKAVELWRLRSESEVQKTLSRKRKRKREKSIDAEGDEVVNDEADEPIDPSAALITEVFVPYVIVRTGGKVRSMDWAGSKSSKSLSMLVAGTNNQIEVYRVDSGKKLKSDEQPDYSRNMSIDMPGHRSDIRCIALSSDDRMLASASQGALKIWNVRTQSCIRTLDCGYALCAAFLPGDKIVVLGTRHGTLEVFDIASSTLLHTIKAHEKDIWSLQVSPDGKSLVTGSADSSAKFWEFKVVQEEVLGTVRKTSKLTLIHTRTLKVADDILAVHFSPDNRLLALSTLDHTVKIFFLDSLKLYLTLYGHKLPVLSIDISYDSKLIVTSSADKNVRVWGLDFGDCHKAFFAHQDSILSVSFVPNNNEGNGHHFFSASKDRVIKYYDGDKFEQIQRLTGHHGEIWAMAIAHSGEFVVSASHDKSIRIWQQTDDPIFLEEEREKELEELYENTLLTNLEQDDREANGDADANEAVDASKQTVQTLMAGEKIEEALGLGMEDLELMREYEEARTLNPKAAIPQRNPMFLANANVSASSYVLGTFQKIPSALLQDALLVLSFSQLPNLFTFLALWASEARAVPLTCRVLFFMIKTHQRQIVSSRLLRVLLGNVRDQLRRTLQLQKTELGYNLAGLRILGRRIGELGESGFVDDIELMEENAKKKGNEKKRSLFVNVA
jgi:U3 small nucleolar RNA-associated protein 12